MLAVAWQRMRHDFETTSALLHNNPVYSKALFTSVHTVLLTGALPHRLAHMVSLMRDHDHDLEASRKHEALVHRQLRNEHEQREQRRLKVKSAGGRGDLDGVHLMDLQAAREALENFYAEPAMWLQGGVENFALKVLDRMHATRLV